MKISKEGRLFIENCTKADAKRDEGLTVPESIEYVEGIGYGDTDKQDLDICFPKNFDGKEKLPVIVSVHGGAYVYGSAKLYKYYCASLAERGFCVVNFNYRLAPEYRFPTPLIDLNLVLERITESDIKDNYPLDLNNVFIVGDSAGAQIASQYGVIYSNDKYRELFDMDLPDITLRGLGLNCGKYVFLDEELDGKDGIYHDYFGDNPRSFGEKLNMIEYVNSYYPPSYILSAPGDFLLPFAKPMKDFLDMKGVKSECKIYGDKKTGHVFHVDVRSVIGQGANDDETAFFRSLIK